MCRQSTIITFIFLLAFCQSNFAFSITKPEKIYPLARISKSVEYYTEQAKLWEAEMDREPSNAQGWFNYFQAARYANMLFLGEEKPFDLDALIVKLPTAIPNTFEFHYLNYLHKGLGPASFEDLMKASEVGGNRPEIFHSMINYHEVGGNREGVRDYCERWYDSGDYSESMMKWNYNMLQSVEENAILITWADNDSYPAWTLQHVQNERTDILVINYWLLAGFDDYRKRIFERTDIIPMENEATFSRIEMLEHLVKNSKRPIYFAPALRQDIRQKFENDLYWTGLAYKHSAKPFDNVAVMKNNFENKLLKDYLTINFERDISKDLVYQMNLNYLPPFLRLYNHYKESGELGKAAKLKTTIQDIAEKGNRKAEIEKYFSVMTPKTPIKSDLNVREIDRGFVKIEDNLYAAEGELAIEKYEQFLMDLLKNKEFEKLNIAKSEKINWREYLPEKYKNLSETKLFRNGDPTLGKSPIVNISHEAAKLYCKWITDVYNNSTHKKKLYKRVLFRLPNKREWILTAKGGHDAKYPWGGYEYTNTKGCYLFNSDVADESPCEDCKVQLPSNDGGFFPVPSTAYFPNNYGCYNMSGNVAEMIDSEGVAMGGSWADSPDNCLVTSAQKYEGASPKIGFRVYMVVLEY